MVDLFFQDVRNRFGGVAFDSSQNEMVEMDGIDLSPDCVGDNLRVCFFSHVLSSLRGALALEVLIARESEICKLYFTSEKARVNALDRIKIRFIDSFVLCDYSAVRFSFAYF